MRFELHSQLHIHKYRVQRAKVRVAEWLQLVENPYIAYSTGKDSTCILDLVRLQASNVPAVCIGIEDLPPESKDMAKNIDNVVLFPSDEPYIDILERIGLDVSWEELDHATMQATVWGPIEKLIAEYNFDGVCYGLRMEENPDTRGMHLKTRGAVFQYKRDGLWGCAPLADWTYDDVWAYIVSNRLEYNAMYDRKWDMPESDQRLSFWAGETKRHWGRYAWLKRNYPDLFNELAARLPEIRSYV